MSVVSKNTYELLGNSHDQDSDREPDPPVKVIDKTPARTTKRNAGGEPPASKNAADHENRGNTRRGGFNGNEGAFRDRNAGSANNRSKPVGEIVQQDRHPRGERPPGSYGGRGAGPRNFDRHSRAVRGDSEKQVSHGWGATEGEAALKDEEAGEALAQKDALTGDEGATDAAPVEEPEPEDNSKSYAEYLAELAEKKLALGAGIPEARKPNEGKQDKKWANAKPIAKEDEEDFVAGSGGKSKRVREREGKQLVEIDYSFTEPQERGGRGGFRGGRSRGDGQSRGGRGEFRGRGDRGGRGRGDGNFRGSRGGPRGGQSGSSAPINTDDKNAFPALG